MVAEYRGVSSRGGRGVADGVKAHFKSSVLTVVAPRTGKPDRTHKSIPIHTSGRIEYPARPLKEWALTAEPSRAPSRELHSRLKAQARWKPIALRILVGLCVLAAVVWFGERIAVYLPTLESWVASHGVWGRVAFVGMVIALTSLFVPDTVLAIAAGVLFGLLWGTVLVVVGSVLTAALDFVIARSLLRARIEGMLERYPKLRAIRSAADHEGLRLQLLLRLAPINPVSVSYVLGASGVRFSTFLIATVGLVPALFVEVYFGYMASHVAEVAGKVGDHSTLHTVVTVVGFLVCIVLVVFIARIATKAVADAEKEAATQSSAEPNP